MSHPRVVRITRSDETDAFVLVHVCHTGPKPLDLTLTATEGECPYKGTVKQSLLKSLRVKNYQGTDDEWARAISLTLGMSTATEEPVALPALEALASIVGSGDDDKELVITIRQRVESITQKLGTIVLTQDDEQAIELFEWSGIATARADALELQAIDLMNRCHAAEDAVRRLGEQLEELILAKSQHEHELIANFARLLNEKKLKVRNQQRLLASATLDPTRVSEIQAAIGKVEVEDEAEADAVRHVNKRRTRHLSDSDDTDDGFEPMDVDRREKVNTLNNHDVGEEEQYTPRSMEEDADTVTDDEVDNEQFANPAQSTSAATQAQPLKRSAPELPPPRRELPFTRRDPTVGKTEVRSEPSGAGNETDAETDDDEL